MTSSDDHETTTGRYELLFRVVAIFQLPTACLGILVGGADLLSAPWLPTRILGLLMSLLGALIIASLIVYCPPRTVNRMLSTNKMRQTDRMRQANRMRLTLAGAVSGLVIDVIFMLNALHYDNQKVLLFALAALPCAAVALYVFNWSLIQPYLKLATTAGLAGALLSVVPFLYNTIYLPSTASIPVELSVTSGAPVAVGSGLDVLDLTITLQDESSIRAVTLTSMVAVYGITYRGKNTDFQGSASQKQALAAGSSRNSLIPNLEFSGTRDRTLVTLRRLINDGSFVPPNVTYTTTVPVLIPVGKYQELDVVPMLSYARSDRLTLTGRYFGPRIEPIKSCPNDVRSDWFIKQSSLGRLTRGTETVVTNWCAAVSDPWVGSFIGGAPGTTTRSRIVRLEEQAYQSGLVSRFWVIELPAALHGGTDSTAHPASAVHRGRGTQCMPGRRD